MSNTTVTALLPDSAITSTDLPFAGNDGGSPLTADISAVATSIPVAELENYPVPCMVRIGQERILVTGRSAASGAGNLTTSAQYRGYDGSDAAAHGRNARVMLAVTAFTLNRMQAELIAISGMLTGALNFLHGLTIEATDAGEVPLTLITHDEQSASPYKFLSLKHEAAGVTSEVGSIVYDAANDQLELRDIVLTAGSGANILLEDDRELRFGTDSDSVFEYDGAAGVLLYAGADLDFSGAALTDIDPKSGAHAIVYRSGSTYYARDRTGVSLATSTTDIGAVINAAISYVVATNQYGTVAVHGATYNQTTTVAMKTGVIVQGGGRESTVIQRQADIVQVSFTEMEGTSNSQNASYLRDLTLKGTNFAYTQPLVKLVNTKVSALEDCNFQDAGGDAVYMTGDTGSNQTFWVRLARCVFQNGGPANAGAFIHADTNAIDGLIEDCIFDGASGASIKGIWLQSGGFRVSRCWINRTKNSIHVDGSLSGMGGFWFNDVILDHASQHAFLVEATTADVSDVHVRNMEIMFAGYLNSGLYNAIHIYPAAGRTIGKLTFEKVRSADFGADKDVAWNIYEDLSAGGTLQTVRYHDVHFSESGLTGDVKIGTVAKISGLAADPFRKVGTVLDYVLEGYTNGAGGRAALFFRKAAGSLDAPTAVPAFDNLGGVNAAGYLGAAWSGSVASVRFWSAGAFSAASAPTYMTFSTTPSGSVAGVERVRIDSVGQVAIGLSGAAQHHLLELGGHARLQSTSALRFGGTAAADHTASLVSIAGGVQLATGDLFVPNRLAVGTTTNPDGIPLYVRQGAGFIPWMVQGTNFDATLEVNDDAGRAALAFRRTGGTSGAKTASPAFQLLGAVNWSGYTGSAYTGTVASVRVWAAEAFTPTSNATYLEFSTTPAGATAAVTRARITQDGFLGLATTDPKYRLDVAGDVRIQSTSALRFGGTGSADTSVVLSSSVADRLDLASGDSFNIVLGAFQLAGTTLFESDRDLAVSLTPNADDSLTLGTSGRNFANVYVKKTAGSVLFMGASGLVTEDNTGLFYDATNDRLGLGTTSPASVVHARRDGGISLTVEGYGSANSATVNLRRANGTLALPTATGAFTQIGSVNAIGYDGSAFTGTLASLSMWAQEDLTALSRATYITLSTTASGATSSTERVRLDQAGYFGINLAGASQHYHLEVDGGIRVRGSNSIFFGGTTGTVNAGLSASTVNRLDVRSGDSFNIVLGAFQLAGTTLFESDRDLAVDLIPNADGTLDAGSAARRLAEGHFSSFIAVGTTPATTGDFRMANAASLSARNAANAADVVLASLDASDILQLYGGVASFTSAGALDIDSTFSIGATVVLEADRDFAIDWMPNADNTLDVGSTARRLAEVHAVTGILGGVRTAVRSESANYVVATGDHTILGTGGAGGITLSLPAATGSGRIVMGKKIDSDVGAVTFDADGTDTIDGAATHALATQYAAAILQDTALGVWSVF